MEITTSARNNLRVMVGLSSRVTRRRVPVRGLPALAQSAVEVTVKKRTRVHFSPDHERELNPVS
jgi:hypothetical protein